jgi:predicted O-methyltransferase YrrM
MKDMKFLYETYNKIQKSDTGFSLHYLFLYSLVLGLECKNIFEFGTGFSTHVLLNSLQETGGHLTSCDIKHYHKNPNVTEYTKQSDRWTFHHGNSNKIFNSIKHCQYDLILHDGSHIGSEVLIDLNNICQYLKHDGILLIHDIKHPKLGRDMSKAFEDFKEGKDLEFCHLPYGLIIIRNKENLKHKVKLTWKKR